MTIETRDGFISRVMPARYRSEEEWSRIEGIEVKRCMGNCDYDGCTGWMKWRRRSDDIFYLLWNAESLVEGDLYRASDGGRYHPPELWERL